MLHMQNLRKVFRTALVETHALRDLTLTVNAGEFVAVTGPSGSGKTTFLNIAGLLEEHTDGLYALDGIDVKQLNDDQRSRLRNEKIGFIFQSFNLIPVLTALDNVALPLQVQNRPAAEVRQRAAEGIAPKDAQTQRRAARQTRRGPFHVTRKIEQVGGLDLVLARRARLGARTRGRSPRPRWRRRARGGRG